MSIQNVVVDEDLVPDDFGPEIDRSTIRWNESNFLSHLIQYWFDDLIYLGSQRDR